jgi:hypothetical protein
MSVVTFSNMLGDGLHDCRLSNTKRANDQTHLFLCIAADNKSLQLLQNGGPGSGMASGWWVTIG